MSNITCNKKIKHANKHYTKTLGEMKLNDPDEGREGEKEERLVKFSIARFKGKSDREADSRYQGACKQEEQMIPPHIHIFIFF